MAIVVTADNRLFSVRHSADPDLAHVWEAIAVRRAKIRGTYEVKPGATPQLLRKVGTRVVSNFRVEG